MHEALVSEQELLAAMHMHFICPYEILSINDHQGLITPHQRTLKVR